MNPVRPESFKKSIATRCNVRRRSNGMNPVRPVWFYTYVLECQGTKTFYTGTTNNLKQRLEQHKKGQVYYTKNKLPVKLVYFEVCLNKDDAYWRERYLKTGMGKPR